ncbi:MAG: hydantoinase/carbamoylase family amidase [Acetobacteraceae bacterium]|nr:hydantoinase/carbamoylase family amidase [Acetobacteraceae bacterium]
MIPNLAPDIALAGRLFDELRERSFDGVGVTREAYGPGEAMAHEVLRREGERLGLEVSSDFARNLYVTLPGTNRAAKRVLLGSHLDSVPQGGNFDGAAGVLAGLAALAGMRAAGFQPSHDVTVVALRAEEAGAWFPTSYPGSRAALGRLRPEELTVRRRDNGHTLEDMLAAAGGDPEAIRRGAKVIGPENTAAYLELHIEQGPVLDAEAIPVGVVTGIPGSRRLRHGHVQGEYSHSGAVPRRFRRDAAIAAAELAFRLDQFWGELERHGQTLVCTFCELATGSQAGFTKIAGEVDFSLDVRSIERSRCDLVFDELNRLIEEISAHRGVTFRLGPETSSLPALMDGAVVAALQNAATALNITHRTMPSGGGHDAAAFAQAGVPAGMLFVRNQNGSHNPHEAMRMEDFALAAAVLTRFAATFGA